MKLCQLKKENNKISQIDFIKHPVYFVTKKYFSYLFLLFLF